MKTYIGDGVYAEIDEHGALVLTTENGVEVTNRIVLEVREWISLSDWVEHARFVMRGKKDSQ